MASDLVIPWADISLPDELLYSWLGRIVSINPLGQARDAMESLVGARGATLVVDLPAHLEALGQRLGKWLPFPNAESTLLEGTLYPFHRPFLTPERDAEVTSMLLHGSGEGVKTLLGIVANRFGAGTTLRCCAECLRYDLGRHGVTYWRRDHQLPGVTACRRHALRLIHVAKPAVSASRQVAVLAPAPSARLDALAMPCAPGELRFAQMAGELLDAGLTPVAPDARQRAYRNAMGERGYLLASGRVRFVALADALREHFDDFKEFAHRERLLASDSCPLAWLRDLIGRPGRAVHPICHLLLIDFLFGSLVHYARAIELTRALDYTGEAMPAAHGSGPPQAVRPHPSVLDAQISCSEAARRAGLSVTTVVNARRAQGIPIAERRKSLTASTLKAVEDALLQGLRPAIVAENVQASLSTVYRVRATLLPALAPVWERRRMQEVENLRRTWVSALQHAGGRVNDARRASPEIYSRLYRADRQWLGQLVVPRVDASSVGRRHIDWGARDATLAAAAAQYVDAVLQCDRPRRITQALISRQLGQAMVHRNLYRLPLLRQSLERMVESPLAYEQRRIDWAVAQLAAADLPLDDWRIRRLANPRSWNRR